jgi:DNA-directed RNA polymerase specialized sigma24 family protein
VVARGRRCPLPLAELPDRPDRTIVDSQVLDRAVLRDALDRLPPHFRAVVIS